MRCILFDQRFHILGWPAVIINRILPVPVIEQVPVPIVQPEDHRGPPGESCRLADQLFPHGIQKRISDCAPIKFRHFNGLQLHQYVLPPSLEILRDRRLCLRCVSKQQLIDKAAACQLRRELLPVYSQYVLCV